MALDLTPEQRDIGKANFQRAVGAMAQDTPPADGAPRPGMTRRSFMKGLMAAGAVLPVSAAAYFGYSRLHGRPVRAGLIGAGDEGGVLVGEHNPEFLEFIAYSDIRPSNQKRIFEDERVANPVNPRPNPNSPRRGFKYHYGNNAQRQIRLYENYRDLLANPEIEVVVIALPLHLHAQATMDALAAGKHVLCEKLMARNVRQCKDMIAAAVRAERLLAIGHQRHYSMLYAQANELLQSELLGSVKHIRALWHRNNAPPRPDSWRPAIKEEDRRALADRIGEFGYRSMEELVRWRLYQRTGAGLMAELGSHQLDACSIFLGKKHPIAVSGVGVKSFYTDDREVEDEVFCTFEFPGKGYVPGRPARDARGVPVQNDVVIVTYSSISTNRFEKYGECVMGPKGTLLVEEEQTAMLVPDMGRSTAMAVTRTPAGQPAIDTSSSSGPGPEAAQDVGQRSLGTAPVSRGYREEMEHLAWCIRMRDQGMATEREDMKPRCHGEAAMADAIIALAANEAMRSQRRIVFDERWFDASSPVVPDWDPQVETSARAQRG